MFYEQIRDAYSLYKRGVCSAFEHFHKAIELIYNLGPDREVYVDLKPVVLKHNCVLALMPYQIHYLPYDKNNDGYCTVLPSEYSDEFIELTKDKSVRNSIISNENYCSLFLTEMRELVEKHENSNDNRFIVNAHVNMLLGRLLQCLEFVTDLKKSQSIDFIQAVVKYVDQHYAEPLSIESVAQYFGYSKYYFSRLFNKCFYTSFTNYFNTVRIYKSIPLIQKYHSSEIFFRVGFASVQQYITYFKRTTGCTPSQYRHNTNFIDRN